jgi:SAM-dependent methyltransferase
MMVTRNTYYYEAHSRTCAPQDYWGQVKRTVRGTPVGDDQIELIVTAIVAGLDLRADDRLLDLCCGNGALTARLAPRCRGVLGVDFSTHLIAVAKRDFEAPPQQAYLCMDAVDFAHSTSDTDDVTLALCYGAFMFLHEDAAHQMLNDLRRRFPRLRRVFLGNLPDRARMDKFFSPSDYRPGIEHDPHSPTGVWRHATEIVDMAAAAGWDARVTHMPESFYAAGCRYDAVLSRRHDPA